VVLHGEMDAIENAGRQPAAVYRACILYTTLSPCSMCTGAILLYGIGSVVIGENQTFLGAEDLLRSVQWGRHEDLDAAMRIDARHRSLALDLRYFAAVSIKGNPRLLPRDHGRHS
jgi:tRNA(Arg) A34 adenosine deaminase TadA